MANDYISITDLAKHKSEEPNTVIANLMRNRNTIEYLGILEQGIPQSERPMKLNQIAIYQMQILESGDNDRKLLKLLK